MKLNREYLKEIIKGVIGEKTAAKRRGIELPDLAEKLKPYVRPDLQAEYFIHFGSVKKLGVNPKTRFNTPVGIYAYPLTDKIYEILIGGNLPYAQDQRYLVLFKPKTFENVFKITPEQDAFTDEQYKDLISKVVNYAEKNLDIKLEEEDSPFQIGEILKYSQKFYEKAKSLPIYIKRPDMLKKFMRERFRVVGIKNGIYIRKIGEDQKSKIIQLPTKELENLEVETKAKPKSKKEKIKELYSSAVDTSRRDSNISKFWNFTRLVTGRGIPWGIMLRKIGINGFVDYDTDTIHPSEPTQAVFFGRDLLDVINIFDNELTTLGTRKISSRKEKLSKGQFVVGDVIKPSKELIDFKINFIKNADLNNLKYDSEEYKKYQLLPPLASMQSPKGFVVTSSDNSIVIAKSKSDANVETTIEPDEEKDWQLVKHS